MEKKQFLQTITLIISFFVINQFATAQCSGDQVLMSQGFINTSICNCPTTCKTKCVHTNQVQHYLDMGWHLGPCQLLVNRCTQTCGSFIARQKIQMPMNNVYPDPASKLATVSFSFSQSQNVSPKILDLKGRPVTMLPERTTQVGDNELVWDVNKNQSFNQQRNYRLKKYL